MLIFFEYIVLRQVVLIITAKANNINNNIITIE